MPLETTATYIDSLNQAWPDESLSDTLDLLDDHLRLVKAAIRRTFPNVAGVVSASWSSFNNLADINQHPQTQFANLREGTATAHAALNVAYAQSASYAAQAGTANVALDVGNIGRVYYRVLTDRLSAVAFASSAPYSIAGTSLSLSLSGLYRLKGLLLGERTFGGYPQGFGISITDTYMLVAPYLIMQGGESDTAVVTVGQSMLGASASASQDVRQTLQRTFGAIYAPSWSDARVHYAYEELFAVRFDGLVNKPDHSGAFRVAQQMTFWVVRGPGGISLVSGTIVINKGSFMWAQRLGDSVPGFR